MAETKNQSVFASAGRIVVCKYRLSEKPSDLELGVNNSVVFDDEFAVLYAEPMPVESADERKICGMCNSSFLPSEKTGFFSVAPFLQDAPASGVLNFCSVKCINRFRNKIEYKRRAALFAAYGLSGKRCQLNSFPGYHCGMLADIEVKPQPSGDDALTIGDYCGKLHAVKGLALSAKDATVLQLEALKVSLERESTKSAARIARVHTAINNLVRSKL